MISKKLFRVSVQSFFRKVHLLKPVEQLRYRIKKWRLRKRNKQFIRENPGFALPPEHLAFDAYSSSHWEFYKLSGEVTAKFLGGIIDNYFSSANPLNKIYEWGCGPARITRQLRSVVKEPVGIYASDYNAESIEWCKKNIPGIQFSMNKLHPPLPYANDQFDLIYAISVFTHLSETNGLQWADELYRILRPGGILLITTAGDTIYEKELLLGERKRYDEEGLVIRANYEEGKKMFLAMHSPKYIREKVLNRFEILEHVPAAFPYMRQDYWIVKKKDSEATKSH